MKFSLRERVSDGATGYQPKRSYELNWPLFFALSGIEAIGTEEGLGKANGFVKKVRASLSNPEVSVTGMAYQTLAQEQLIKAVVTYNETPLDKIHDTEFQKLMDELTEVELSHLYLNNNGQKYSLDELKQNFRGLNFCVYSFGANIAFGMCNAFAKLMAEAGYNEPEKKEAIANIGVITLGCCTEFDKLKYPPYCIHIMNAADSLIHNYGKNRLTIAKAFGVDTSFMEDLEIWELDKSNRMRNELIQKAAEAGGIAYAKLSETQMVVMTKLEQLITPRDHDHFKALQTGHHPDIYLAQNFDLLCRAALEVLGETLGQITALHHQISCSMTKARLLVVT
jgi:hypothetical protein